MNNPDLSIVIPAFNESEIILENVDELADYLVFNMPSTTFEILVVDDGSTDSMATLLSSAKETRPWLQIAQHQCNLGRGRGVRTGFQSSLGKYIVCLDADLSYSPSIIPDLLKPLIEGKTDISLASAHHPEGAMVNVPTQRAMLSKWGNSVLGMGFEGGFHTVTCVVRGFTREIVNSLELVSDGKELHLEILQKAQLLGARIIEVPATLEWRDIKRGMKNRTSIFPEIAIYKMRKTVLSHLVFNYITNPGVLLFVPIFFLFLVMLSTFSMLVIGFSGLLTSTDLSIFQALRETFIGGQLSLLIFLFSLITFMVFSVFYFLSNQNKRYFEESYTLMMRMNSRIKSLESELFRDKK